MTDLVPASEIEAAVGVPRHRKAHYGRAVSAEQTVYILHSRECLETVVDLRYCRFSVALDRGIRDKDWARAFDVPVALGVWEGRLVPLEGTQVRGEHDANA